MIQVLTEKELAAVVAGLDTMRFINRTVFGCGCGANHGVACPGGVR